MLQIDLGKQPNLDDLPDETENKMFTPFDQILRTDIDDTAANGFGRIDDHIVVFRHLERVDLGTLVEHTLVNSLGNRVIDQFASVVHETNCQTDVDQDDKNRLPQE